MEWTVAIAGASLLLVAALSRPLGSSPFSTAMVFVAIGLLAGPKLLDAIDVSSTGPLVRGLAETALALVLFCEAARINLGSLRSQPRGLASIVFALILVEESQLPHEQVLLVAIYLTVGISVFVHGATAVPLAKRYADWYQRHPRDRAPSMEAAVAEVTRARQLTV